MNWKCSVRYTSPFFFKRWVALGILLLVGSTIRPNAATAQKLGEAALQKAFCSWSLIDLARAIARESRPHIARALMKSHLALYGCLYGISAEELSAESNETFRTLTVVLPALRVATHDLLQVPTSSEEWGAQLIIDEVITLWEPLQKSFFASPVPGAGKAETATDKRRGPNMITRKRE